MNSSAKTNQFLHAIMLLSRGSYVSANDLAISLGTGLRTAYRYIQDIEASSLFIVSKRGSAYRISSRSPFWPTERHGVNFSEQEAFALYDFMKGLEPGSGTEAIREIQSKLKTCLAECYDTRKQSEDVLEQNISRIYVAMKEKKMCILKNYTSAHSETCTDRLVEPYFILGSKNDVRCFEISSGINKTFKISRCSEVVIVEMGWQFESKHKPFYTDIFHYSSESPERLRLILNLRAKTILEEEYPSSVNFLYPREDGRWTLDAEFCSYIGVGRFVLGLIDDIEITNSPGFKAYLREKVKILTKNQQQ